MTLVSADPSSLRDISWAWIALNAALRCERHGSLDKTDRSAANHSESRLLQVRDGTRNLTKAASIRLLTCVKGGDGGFLRGVFLFNVREHRGRETRGTNFGHLGSLTRIQQQIQK